MAGELGYISSFDGLDLISTYGTPKSVIGNTDEVNVHIVKLDNGTVINYDGILDASFSPGSGEQTLGLHTTAVAAYGLMQAKKSLRGLVTKTKLAGGTETCTGVLEDVVLKSIDAPNGAALHVTLYFNFETSWA